MAQWHICQDEMSKMMQLRCGVLKESIVFTVEVDRGATGANLKEAIVGKKRDASDKFRVNPDDLTLHLALDERNKWLKLGPNIWQFLKDGSCAYEEIASARKLHDMAPFQASWQPRLDEVHILIRCLRLKTARAMNSDTRIHRSERWQSIAEAISTSSVNRKKISVVWPSIAPLNNEDLRGCTVTPLPISADALAALSTTLSYLLQSHDFTFIGSANKGAANRLQWISQVVWTVALLIPDVMVHVEVNLKDHPLPSRSYRKCDVQFEFVLERGSKRIGIYQVRDALFHFATTYALLGCEALAYLHDTSEVYAVVTDGEKWLFLQSFDSMILCDSSTLLTFASTPAKQVESLKEVTGKLYALLTN